MAKTAPKLPSFCLNRIRPHVRVRSPPLQATKLDTNLTKQDDQKTDQCSSKDVKDEKNENGAKPKLVFSRKIMVVVDSSIEAKGALQWTLSHTIQNQDKLILLHVTKQSSKQASSIEEPRKKINPKAYELVCNLKSLCEFKRPEVQVEVVVVEGGKEKGERIVEEAKKQGVGMVVLGQKKRSTTWRLLMMWAGNNRVSCGVVEYVIQNANCMAIAVRRKSKKLGGYLITTKRQKDFWLLA